LQAPSLPARALPRAALGGDREVALGGPLRGADGRGRARLHLRRWRSTALPDGRPALLAGRARGRGLRARVREARRRYGRGHAVQARAAADREAVPALGRARLPLLARLEEVRSRRDAARRHLLGAACGSIPGYA